MSQTVRIDWQHILSRVRISVRPRIVLYAKNTQNYREYRVACATVYLNEVATGHWSPAPLAKEGVNSVMGHGWAHRPIEQRHPVRRWQWVGVCASVRVCARACVRACMRDVFAIYDNNIWPRLIMIILKIIMLYFIEIAHTDDFPSTGIRLVFSNRHREQHPGDSRQQHFHVVTFPRFRSRGNTSFIAVQCRIKMVTMPKQSLDYTRTIVHQIIWSGRQMFSVNILTCD